MFKKAVFMLLKMEHSSIVTRIFFFLFIIFPFQIQHSFIIWDYEAILHQIPVQTSLLR